MLLVTLTNSCRKTDYKLEGQFQVISDFGFGTGTTVWKANTQYLIDGLVFVNDGQKLTIEPGTVVRFKAGQADKASALIVARGGKIVAEGTPQKPIIFTAESDDLKGSVPLYAQGLWGGIIILGNARINTTGGEAHIEGISLNEPRAVYGGQVDNDNSGSLKYVSIRHGGTNIGDGNEINGLTLGGVGDETKIEFVEVVSNKDDGFEFFGGTVNARYLVSAFCGDDAFDYDLGYHGKGQFWCGLQSAAGGDKLIEADGNSVEKIISIPNSKPTLYNLTLVGNRDGSGDQLVSFNTNAAGSLQNCIMVEQDNGVVVEFSSFRANSYTQILDGKLKLTNNLFFSINDNTPDGMFRVHGINGENTNEQDNYMESYFHTAANRIVDPGFIVSQSEFNLNPQAAEVFENLHPYDDTWFLEVPYKGAFFNTNWADWTLVGQTGTLVIR